MPLVQIQVADQNVTLHLLTLVLSTLLFLHLHIFLHTIHNSCHLLSHLLLFFDSLYLKNVDPDPTATLGAVRSGLVLFDSIVKDFWRAFEYMQQTL